MTARVLPSGWRGRIPLLVLVVAVVVAVVLIATAGAEGSLNYYRTPSEVLAAPSGGQVRLGGLVVPGSIHRHRDAISFALTDEKHQVEVVSEAVPPRTFRAGQGAVVQGTLDDHGVFEARSVVVRHDNQYQPSEMLDH